MYVLCTMAHFQTVINFFFLIQRFVCWNNSALFYYSIVFSYPATMYVHMYISRKLTVTPVICFIRFLKLLNIPQLFDLPTSLIVSKLC